MSDNKTYSDYSVPIDELLEIWQFTCSINTQEYDEQELKISSIINMFNDLGAEVKALEKLKTKKNQSHRLDGYSPLGITLWFSVENQPTPNIIKVI